MATSQPDLFTELEEMASCALCLERCQQPHTLPCLHTFCLSCLTQLIEKAKQTAGQTDGQAAAHSCGQTAQKTDGQKGIISCPSCRTQVPVPPSGAEAFPRMFHWATLTETLDRFKGLGLSQKPECTLCLQDGKHADGSKLCSECMKVFCADCLNTHNKLMPGHKLLDCADIKSEDLNMILKNTPEICEEHGEEIKLYCEECKELLCMMCGLLEHAPHTKQQLAKVADTHKAGLDDMHGQMSSRAEHYQQCLQKVDASLKTRHTDMQSKIQSLEQHGEQIVLQVRKFVNEIKSEIKAETARSIKQLESLKQTLNDEMSCLIDSAKKIKMSLNHGNTPTVIRTSVKDKPSFETLLQDLLPKHALPNLTIDLCLTDVKQLERKSVVGSVEFKQEKEVLREAGGKEGPASGQKVKGTPKVTVDTWRDPSYYLSISECASNGTYITLQYTKSSYRYYTIDWRIVRNIDGEERVNITLPRLKINGKHKLFAQGQKAAGGGTESEYDCDIETWGTGDNIVTTLYHKNGTKLATHTQTTTYT